jgi:hypothetical protein
MMATATTSTTTTSMATTATTASTSGPDPAVMSAIERGNAVVFFDVVLGEGDHAAELGRIKLELFVKDVRPMMMMMMMIWILYYCYIALIQTASLLLSSKLTQPDTISI